MHEKFTQLQVTDEIIGQKGDTYQTHCCHKNEHSCFQYRMLQCTSCMV